MRSAFLLVPFLALVACTADAPAPSVPNTPNTQTPEASPPAEAPATESPTAEPTRVVEPLAALYDVVAYQPPEFGIGSRPFPTRIAPPTIDAANEEASLFLADRYPQPDDPAAFQGVPGLPERRCFDATADEVAGTRLRSGDFVLDTLNWQSPAYAFELLAHEPADRIFIRATYLDAVDTTNPPTTMHEYEHRSVAPNAATTPTFVPHEEGRWLVVVTAGPQWGCFVLDAPEPDAHYIPARTVAEAEQDGEAYPVTDLPAYASPAFAKDRGPDVKEQGFTAGGGPRRLCLDVTGIHEARSGEWVVRPTTSLFDEPPIATGNKFLLIPRIQPETRQELDAWAGQSTLHLRMTATYLDAPQHTYVYESRSPGGYTPAGPMGEGGFQFSHIPAAVLPRLGPWMVVVTDGIGGSQWGCFTSPGHGAPYPYDTN